MPSFLPTSASNARKLEALWHKVFMLHREHKLSDVAYSAYKHVIRQLAANWQIPIEDRELLMP